MEKHDTDDIDAWLVLLRTPGMGAAALRDLLAVCNWDIQATLATVKARVDRLDGAAAAWLKRPDRERLRADRTWLDMPGHRLLRCDEADFPPLLGHIDRPPAALFVDGDASLLLRPQVAVVGSRAADGVGRALAADFALALADAGFVVTSGMADGIDGAAHRAVLDAGHPTIAVVGTGADRVYPAKHARLARRIAGEGALLSEFPLGTGARSSHFPQRNRILSGLSVGTVVVEADLKSGSLITARLAADQGREVFAVPGSVHNPRARGCNKLIRDGARLVEDAGEVVDVLAPLARAMGLELRERLRLAEPAQGSTGPVSTRFDPLQERLLEALGHVPVSLDELAERTGLEAGQVASGLLLLELDGAIESLAGNRYQRLPGGCRM
ncbi:DNA-processing protein DprA [Dyella sp.]|uniref:DNA-processing protein DprA n=1 Tax=Dyella sp. TaxID=1869338 RepID=UPI002ED2A522